MKFRTQLIWTILIQGIGALATFVTVLLIGSKIGLEAQGLFSRFKSEIEFISAASQLGMAQAVFYFLKAEKMTVPMALKISVFLGVIALIVSEIYLGGRQSNKWAEIYLFGFTAAVVVIHAILRVIVLAVSGTRIFNVITALPQLLILILVIGIIFSKKISLMVFSLIYFSAFGASCLFAIIAIRFSSKVLLVKLSNVVSIKELMGYGAATWFISSLSTATSLSWLRHIESKLDLSAVGIFSMGIILIQMCLIPFNYAAPLLFKQWMESGNLSQITRFAVISGLGALIIIVTGIKMYDFLPLPVSTLMMKYNNLQDLKWALAVAAAAEVVIKIMTVGVLASGNPWKAVISEFVRLCILVIAILAEYIINLKSVANFWAIASVMSAFSIVIVANCKFKLNCRYFVINF